MSMGSGRPVSTPWSARLCCGAGAVAVLWLVRSFIFHPADRCSLDSYDAATTTELDLKKCGLTSLPASIASFTVLTKLDLGHNALKTLPPVLPVSLLTLFCLNNHFETVPAVVATLPRLRMLSFKSCRLRDTGDGPLPTTIVWLILTDNKLTSLPESLGRLIGMRKLMLANNRLKALPDSMASMLELELLRIANNRLATFPRWLYELPKLSWLAIAGNPAVEPAPARASLPAVQYDELSLGDKLGEGTSSIVRRGEWHGQTVAIKVYKAQLSSDGKNLDEVRASCAVDHPNVLRWLGYLEEGAQQEARATVASAGGWRLIGVLEWAPGFISLGKPPSMQSITRDTYPDGTAFTAAEIRAIALNIASALEHLHSRGVAHGDLYAHNILWRRAEVVASSPSAPMGHRHRQPQTADQPTQPAAVAKLSDFGAAFFYGPTSAEAAVYERMEQRAFGLLLEELLERHDGSEPNTLTAVREAAHASSAAPPEHRPGFAKLVQMLSTRPMPARRGLRPRSKVFSPGLTWPFRTHPLPRLCSAQKTQGSNH